VGVPVTWDETRFVTGDAGEYIVLARRHGDAWYLGGMTNWTPRDVTVPLDFLPRGTYQAQLYVDGSMDEEKPNAIRSESLAVESGGSLEVKMASGGGFTAVITRE
ncbi:glycoside hydrolase family 97 C-terminal domain-containing protein, partial [Candidatus Uhrbacteria bacterium]|nr:glycoside hydrolase family 97 C-terminal domain-containing protein [Candidatus Uhrbacteria bacterium]